MTCSTLCRLSAHAPYPAHTLPHDKREERKKRQNVRGVRTVQNTPPRMWGSTNSTAGERTAERRPQPNEAAGPHTRGFVYRLSSLASSDVATTWYRRTERLRPGRGAYRSLRRSTYPPQQASYVFGHADAPAGGRHRHTSPHAMHRGWRADRKKIWKSVVIHCFNSFSGVISGFSFDCL